MKARLISYSQPTEELREQGINSVTDLVAYCAKVSNIEGQDDLSRAEGLLRYLIRNAHWSPLEMVSICVEIHTTRDIARQILRHRSAAFQEFSQRYADPTFLEFEVREARLQDEKNRQNSIELTEAMSEYKAKKLQEEWEAQQETVISTAKTAYDWAIAHGIAKEQARVVLPEGNTGSKLYMNGYLRTWFHYCQLRRGNGTQKEHMLIAEAATVEIAKIYPAITTMLDES